MGGIRIAYGDDPDQFGEWWMPGAGLAPVGSAMLLHGGYYRSAYGLDLMTPTAADLAARGWAVWNVEYRRPDAHDWPATLSDVRAAHAELARIPSFVFAALSAALPLIVIGHSAGGQLALQLAEQAAARAAAASATLAAPAPAAPTLAAAAPGTHATRDPSLATPPPFALAVSLAGVVDLPGAHARNSSDGAVAMALGGSPAEPPERYAAASPSLFARRLVPWLLVQGTDDADDFALPNRDLAANARLGHPELLELPGDHFAVIDPATPIWQATLARITTLVS